MENRNIEFELFRYQLLPITQQAQVDTFNKIKDVEDIKKNKNVFFFKVINKLPSLKHRSFQLNQQIIINSPPWLVFKIAAKKTIDIENRNFKKESIDNWPTVTVIINNDPEIQIIAISKNIKAFSGGKVVKNILVENLKDYLLQYQLTMQVEAIFDENNFWEIVDDYKGKISNVKFELISPNMSNISKVLKLDLIQINKDTNSHRTILDLHSSEDAVLEIKKDNKLLNSLIQYTSKGGGDISFKVKGIKKHFHTSKTTKTVEISELEVDNMSEDSLNTFINHLFKI